jgi:acetyltransferase
MEFFFKPKGVALIGASANPLKGGYHILKNLMLSYKENIYPVNPGYQEIESLKCYSSVLEVPDFSGLDAGGQSHRPVAGGRASRA